VHGKSFEWRSICWKVVDCETVTINTHRVKTGLISSLLNQNEQASLLLMKMLLILDLCFLNILCVLAKTAKEQDSKLTYTFPQFTSFTIHFVNSTNQIVCVEVMSSATFLSSSQDIHILFYMRLYCRGSKILPQNPHGVLRLDVEVFNSVGKWSPNPDSRPYSQNLDNLSPSRLTFVAFILATLYPHDIDWC